jgi:signal transduction histidine kinase
LVRPTTFDRPPTADLALAGVLAVAGVAGSALAGAVARPPVGVPGYALVVAAALALAVRRRWPLVTLAAAALCTSAYLILGYPYGPILIVFMLAGYSATRHARPRRAVWYTTAAALALTLIHLLTSDRQLGGLGVVPVTAWVVVPAAIGYGLRVRQESARQARAEVIRQRVAQEVHDIVGHGLAAIKMQADIALHVLERKPGQAQVALAAISRTSSQALDELRATLAAVRRTDDDGRGLTAGLGRLDDLRQRMADAGVRVRLRTSGEHGAGIPAAVDLAGYRIVQESLTNVLRHSRCEEADVTVRYEADGVAITVSNPVIGTPPAGAGSGIAGMRARVEALGGEFTAGAVARRFEVHARLPIGSPA